MSANNVPNKIEKEYIFWNMIIESGINLINEENQTNFLHTKFKKHKNNINQKVEATNSQKIKTKSAFLFKKRFKKYKN